MANEINMNLSVITSAMGANDKSGHQTAPLLSDSAKVSAATKRSVEEADQSRLNNSALQSETKQNETDETTQFNGLSQTELEKKAQELQELSINKNWGVSFSVDKQLNQTVIKVIDAETDKTIRQIPSEEFLEVNKRIQALRDSAESGDGLLVGMLFNKQA